MTNKITVLNSFVMPAEDETFEVTVSDTKSLAPNCWLWNESVGYLEVVKYSLYNNIITVRNLGRRENAKRGTEFPTCMEFLITAPTALDPYNPLSTCLAADFKSPTVGQEAYVSVGSTYVIKVDDQIIVDGDYRYAVTQVVNATTLKVRNEGLGKEGIIEVGCDSCVPVQVVSKLNCCPIPSGDLTSNTSVLTVNNGYDALLDNASLTLDTDLSKYDNSTSEFITLNDVPRGTLNSNSSLLGVTGGANNVLGNITLSLDTDLSKYDNSSSEFITIGDIPRGELYSSTSILTVNNGDNNVLGNIELSVDTDLSKYNNTISRFLASSDKKNLTSTTSVLSVTNGTGATLENASLSLDTDLSKYDNTTSSFVSASDKKNLISTSPILTVTNGTGATLENTSLTLNTDLSQYDNTTSGFITGVSNLSDIGDVTLTSPQDGDVLTYDANSGEWINSAGGGGSYLPLAGGTMTGSIRVSGSGFTLGNSTQGWSTVYAGQVLNNSNTLRVGGDDASIFYFTPTSTAATNCLGSSTSSWSSGYIDSVYATNIKLTDALTIGIPSDVSAYKRITIKGYDGNTESTLTDWAWLGWVNTGVFGFRPITSNTGTIGTRSEYWNKGYFTELHTSSIYSSYDAVNSVSKIDLYYNTNATESAPVQWGVMGQKSANEIGIFPLVGNVYLGSSSNYWTATYSNLVYFSSNANIFSVASGNGMQLNWYDAANSKSRGLQLVGASFRPSNTTEVSLGDQYGLWKDLYLTAGSSGGIYFGADTSHSYIRDVTSNTLVLNATGTVKIHHSGTQRYQFSNTNFVPVGGSSNSIDLGAGGTGYRWNTIYYVTLNPPSDIRLKENIEPLESGLSIVNDLDIKSFTFKNSPDHIEYGIIAQNVAEKYPELISVPDSEEGTYGTYLHNFIFASLRAIQELSSKVDELNAKIKVLEGKL